jgi:hypothetical protein
MEVVHLNQKQLGLADTSVRLALNAGEVKAPG